jgi:hypothetical protein
MIGLIVIITYYIGNISITAGSRPEEK